MAKRLLCVLLSVLMVVAMLPMGVVADNSRTTVTIDGVEYTVVADSSTATSSGGWNSYFDYNYKSSAMADGAMIYIEYTCTVAPSSYAAIKYQYGKDNTFDYYDEHYFTGSIKTGEGTHSYAVLGSTIIKYSSNQYGQSDDYSYCNTIIQWGDSSSSETTTDFTLTYAALVVPVEDTGDDDSGDSGTTTTTTGDYTFSDVTVSNRWSSSTTYSANEDGSLTYTFTSQYEEV